MMYETLENGVLSLKETTLCPKCGYEATDSENYLIVSIVSIKGKTNKEMQKRFSKVNGKYCMGCFALFISEHITKVE